MRSGRVTIPAIAATVAVILTLVAGIVTLGSPSRARQRRLDQRRITDLIEISHAVDDYWNRHKLLPPSLDTVVSDHDLSSIPRDPATNAPYPYSVTSPGAFRLCATFQQPQDGANRIEFDYALNHRRWRHAVGPACFDLTPPNAPH